MKRRKFHGFHFRHCIVAELHGTILCRGDVRLPSVVSRGSAWIIYCSPVGSTILPFNISQNCSSQCYSGRDDPDQMVWSGYNCKIFIYAGQRRSIVWLPWNYKVRRLGSCYFAVSRLYEILWCNQHVVDINRLILADFIAHRRLARFIW